MAILTGQTQSLHQPEELTGRETGLTDYLAQRSLTHLLAVPRQSYRQPAFDVDAVAALLAHEDKAGGDKRSGGFTRSDPGKLRHRLRLLPVPVR